MCISLNDYGKPSKIVHKVTNHFLYHVLLQFHVTYLENYIQIYK